ncbi:MAG: RNA polymerase sigma factor [Bryobacteraceae bacterium]
MLDDDHSLLAQALGGDEAAFSALYRRRQGQIFRFAFHMTGNRSAAEDATQETFLALIERNGCPDASRGPLLPFLYGIARNKILRQFEKRRLEMDLDMASNNADSVAGALDELARMESIIELRRAIVCMPTPYREAIVLCDLEGATYEDAAIALSCPVGTIRSRLSRGRVLLAQKLNAARTTNVRTARSIV